MDSSFLRELSSLPGHRQPPDLPCVFIAGRYIGGADEIRQLYEAGEFRRLVEGAPPAGATCDRSGGGSFVLCWGYSGSHKRYSEKGGFRSCAACNEKILKERERGISTLDAGNTQATTTEVSSPTIIVEKAGSYSWTHKSWRVRKEFVHSVARTIGLFASTQATLQRVLLPLVLQLLSGSNNSVREAATACLEY